MGVLHRQLAAPAPRGRRQEPAAVRSALAAQAQLLRAFDAVHRLEQVRHASLRISNDREYYEGGQEQLWRIEPGKTPALYTERKGGSPCASGAWASPATTSSSTATRNIS